MQRSTAVSVVPSDEVDELELVLSEIDVLEVLEVLVNDSSCVETGTLSGSLLELGVTGGSSMVVSPLPPFLVSLDEL